MKLVRVAAAALNQTPLAWDGNKSNILKAVEAARQQHVGILCLPELCIPGYGCEDAFHSPGHCRMCLEVLEEILPETRGIVVSVGLPLFYNHALFNAAGLIADGRVLGFVAKRNLAGDGLHYEPRWFKPWPQGQRVDIRFAGRDVPLGDFHFDCGGVKIGFEICEDAWVANRPGGELSLKAVDVLLNPSASHFAFGKNEIRQRFVLEGARAFNVTYVYANLLGNDAGRVLYDGGVMIASGNKMMAVGPRFSFADFQMTSATVDIDATRMNQARLASYVPDIAALGAVVSAPFEYPAVDPEPKHLEQPAWETSRALKEEEFTRAVGLALFDYLRKSRASGFVVSLSGGADSTAVACLVSGMVHLGIGELGFKEFCNKLSHIRTLPGCGDDIRGVVRRLLTCVYQSTRNSSQATRDAARGTAIALGADFLEFDVDALVQQYVEMVSKATGQELSWKTHDAALQNIQARVRAPGAWLLANLRNALLLATSNRSEAAVGYATMDGDTCGGVSPIAGIDKAFLRRWLRWLETDGPEGIGPQPALAAVNSQKPTAELRPPGAGQTDEDDLMPYDLLDAIERAAIRDKYVPVEVFHLTSKMFPQYRPEQLALWIERFFRLWCRNQWKRERYAPSFHVDDENLDPKTWCRFPILSGGFERELADLRRHVSGLERRP